MRRWYLTGLFACLFAFPVMAQQVDFCGEMVPMERDFVSSRLMDVIKRNLRYQGYLPVLRSKAEMYFPVIEPILQQYQVPLDFKYLPIVESGLTNATSPVGAQGVWQIMPGTAAELGLTVAGDYDERNHLIKATHAACRLIRMLHSQLQSWTLAAAAYNCGAGNISKNIRRQGSRDYYQLMLNNETAQYIYKIIAIKQLFESPELYLPGFGYNVFAKRDSKGSVFANPQTPPPGNIRDFNTIRITIGKKALPKQSSSVYAARLQINAAFRDGELISIHMLENMQANGVYVGRNASLSGKGWIISNRVYVDLGFGNTVVLCATDGKKGVPLDLLKTGGEVKLLSTASHISTSLMNTRNGNVLADFSSSWSSSSSFK
ncbi:Transglycosylase SLT domain-containing protein [Chitinophaga eiseniae]|uniref:Transglycosylase SLT domain-containing protein n=1 Tax=Chitinophaga eiseniae TaxID=634771 RepID=A0A1T4TL55_9BACT|nr:lytic transglycosylase domain-containing protein [Chitinophaga eiseniae]SKA40979.1 Transglycosylase SLT domain-containing protein [Chitinophaga eiseniae]